MSLANPYREQGPVKVSISSLRAQRSNLPHGATVRLLRRYAPRNDPKSDFDRAMPREYGLWHYVWKLLRLRGLIIFSDFRHAKLRRKIGYIVAAVFVLAILIGVFVASWALLSFLRSPQLAEFIDLTLFLASVPVIIVSIAFFAILGTSFALLLQALYLAGDMEFLLSAPVPIRAVFLAKLLEAILPNFALVSLFSLPVLYGLGVAGRYNLLYYPLVVLVLVAMALAAAGLASLLVMSIVRLVPARRVAEVLGLIVGVFSLLCSQSNLLFNSAQGSSEISSAQASQALNLLTRLNTPWSPLAWAGRGLLDMGEGRWLTGLGFLALTLGGVGVIFALALRTAERLYYTGWARVQVGARRKKVARPSRPVVERSAPLVAVVEHIVPAAVRGLIGKDLLVIRRDLRSMSQLISPLILGVIYAVLLIRGGGQAPAGRGEAPLWFMQAMQNVLVYGNVAISLFVGWMLLSRLAMMGFSQEGKNYWLLKSAPLSANQLLSAKFLVAYLPTLLLGGGLLLVISLLQRAGLGALLFGLAVVALCFAGAAGINLAFGVVGVNLAWEDPRQMTRGTTGCLGMLAGAGYMLVTLALFFIPPIVLALMGRSETTGQLIGLVLGGIVSLFCAILPPMLVRDRVPRIGEV